MLRVLQTVCLLRARAHVKSFAAHDVPRAEPFPLGILLVAHLLVRNLQTVCLLQARAHVESFGAHVVPRAEPFPLATLHVARLLVWSDSRWSDSNVA